MKGRRGFTLIELLVVVGIIVILIGILLPSLSKARARGRTGVCLAHERALGQAMNIYCVDWGNPHILPRDGYITWPLMLFGQGVTLEISLQVGGLAQTDLGAIPAGSAFRKISDLPGNLSAGLDQARRRPPPDIWGPPGSC